MSWRAPFIRRLQGREPLLHIIESLPEPLSVDPRAPFKQVGQWRITTAPGRMAGRISTALADSQSGAVGTEVMPVAWTSRVGGWSVDLVGDISPLLDRLYRGQLVRHRVGFPGQDLDEFEVVNLGQVVQLSGRPDRWRLEMRDFLSTLQNRFSRTTAATALFSDLSSASTSLGSAYTVGNTTVTVSDTSDFQRQDDGSGSLKGVIKIGDFYLTYTGTTSTTFTGVSTTGQFGTTAVNTSSGTVFGVAYLDDHPIDAAHRILVSTGTAKANGDYDTLPAEWAFGLPEAWVDSKDMMRWRSRSAPSSGSIEWDILSEEAQENGYSWMEGWLAPGGFFFTQRQGAITVRAAVSPDKASTGAQDASAVFSGYVITDEDIASIDGWEAWDSSLGVEYGELRVRTATSSLGHTENVSTLPAQGRYGVDLSDYIFNNEASWRTLVITRLKPWTLRLPERIQIRCAGMRLAVLAVGDIVEIQSNVLRGRLNTTRGGYANRRAMVTRVEPDWWTANSVRLQLAVVPTKADAFN